MHSANWGLVGSRLVRDLLGRLVGQRIVGYVVQQSLGLFVAANVTEPGHALGGELVAGGHGKDGTLLDVGEKISQLHVEECSHVALLRSDVNDLVHDLNAVDPTDLVLNQVDLDDFHELLWSVGFVPIHLIGHQFHP